MTAPKLGQRLAVFILIGVFAGSTWQVFRRHERSSSPHVIEIQLGHWLLHTGMREAFDAAIAGYQAIHPNVRITQIPVPVKSYAAWTRTQLVGETAPDLTGMLTLNEELISRYYLPLSPYLDQPNPYNAGSNLESVPWRDTFIDGLSAMRNLTPTSGEICGVTLQLNSLRLFYNKDLLHEITGVDTPPANFSELMKIGRQVAAYNQRTGQRLVTIAGCGPYARQLFNLLLPSQTQKLTLELSPSRNLRVTSLELAALILEGKVDYDTPEFRNSLNLMRDVSTLLTPGYMQVQRDEAISAYLQQNALMFFAGSWDYAILAADGQFTTGMTPLPLPSPDDPVYGRYVLGPVSEAAGYPEAMLGIIRHSSHPEVALDFLRYLTSRKVAADFSRISHRISSIIGTLPPPDAGQLGPRLQGGINGFTVDFGWFGADLTSNFFQRHIHTATGPHADVPAFARLLNTEIPGYLRQDIARQLTRVKRDIQRLDATIAFQLTLPADAPVRSSWTRHLETQHLRQVDILSYSRYVEP
ncbi:MAG: extracellular solute-binding protein [Cephaloticoccus sp.]|nr:extracellular solute-binding protein [Cephaloticoccus sp.]MCF7759906.1 extracellular solute-binding protein [Cephaloticoccus sp.]